MERRFLKHTSYESYLDGIMDSTTQRISYHRLAELLAQLLPSDEVARCIECLIRVEGTIDLGISGSRENVLRISETRQRIFTKRGITLLGMAKLVQKLRESKAEEVYAIFITETCWRGAIYIEQNETLNCLGCISAGQIT
jgi:hypothetical protein